MKNREKVLNIVPGISFAVKLPLILRGSLAGRVAVCAVLLAAVGVQGCFPQKQASKEVIQSVDPMVFVAPTAEATQSQLKQVKETLSRRLQYAGFQQASVQLKGNQIHVSLPMSSEDERKKVKSWLGKRGHLRVWPAARDQRWMEHVRSLLSKHQVLASAGVQVVEERWTGARGEQVQVLLLEGPDRASLQQALKKIAAMPGAMARPKHQDWVFRQRKGKRWGVYLVSPGSGMVIKSLMSVESMPSASVSGLRVVLHGKDATHFQRTTNDHLGNKLFLMLDQEVVAAPVVKAAISSGRLQLTWDAGSTLSGHARAMLKGGSLPWSLKSL